MTRLSRRELGVALLSLGCASPAFPQSPPDQGIGGTGAAPKPPVAGSDRGIGGTGVIGTIRRFGSIYVNDLRIAYPPNVEVSIDGARARVSDMKIGHVAQAVASGSESALVTQRIQIASEVVGPVEKIAPNGIVVLGQAIDLRGLPQRGDLRTGAFVAVFGHRRANGVIVATLIEPRSARMMKIAGPVSSAPNGGLSIGGMAVRGLPAGLAGSRVSIEGRREGDGFVATGFRSLARPFAADVARVSIEGYLAGNGQRLGSGLAIQGARAGDLGSGSALVVITGRVSASGGFMVDAVRQDQRYQVPGLGGPAPVDPVLSVPNTPGALPVPDGGVFPSPRSLGAPNLGPALPNISPPAGLGLPGRR